MYSIDGYYYPETVRDDDENDYVPGTSMKYNDENYTLEYEIRRCMMIADPIFLKEMNQRANFWGVRRPFDY